MRERCSLIFVAPLLLSEERPDSVAGSPQGYSAAEILPDWLRRFVVLPCGIMASRELLFKSIWDW